MMDYSYNLNLVSCDAIENIVRLLGEHVNTLRRTSKRITDLGVVRQDQRRDNNHMLG